MLPAGFLAAGAAGPGLGAAGVAVEVFLGPEALEGRAVAAGFFSRGLGAVLAGAAPVEPAGFLAGAAVFLSAVEEAVFLATPLVLATPSLLATPLVLGVPLVSRLWALPGREPAAVLAGPVVPGLVLVPALPAVLALGSAGVLVVEAFGRASP